VNWDTSTGPLTLNDGLGTRRIEGDPVERCLVDVLDVGSELSVNPAFESALRARAARFHEVAVPGVAEVRRIDRRGEVLRVAADHVEGLRLPELFHEIGCGHVAFALPATLELTWRIVRATAQIHLRPGMTHGAINPAHVVVTRQGDIVLTDASFGGALEVLQRNREQLWREFQVAMPASANLPRFDARADVTQLGATVLAVLLGRTLQEDEYPRSVADVVNRATEEPRPIQPGSQVSRLRMWLYQALQLHPRENFATAIEAERAFADMVGTTAARRAGAAAFQNALRMLYEDAGPTTEAPGNSNSAISMATVTVKQSAAVTRPSLLKSAFPIFRAS